ncbi:MAG: low molecular weight protein arginine phosphatase [Clostridia bacterium]|nr:low molecular weight protein arginine phosphatase [Clostridia bacterium]
MSGEVTLLSPLFDAVAEKSPCRVLFVCTGNTCRSPMAAAVFCDMAEKEGRGDAFLVSSAGLYASVGEPISAYAVEALARAGVTATPTNDYPAHRARQIEEHMVREADTVVAIGAAHAMQLLMRYPAYAAKITTLPIDISDPYGGTLATYCDCLDALSYAIRLKWFLGEGE